MFWLAIGISSLFLIIKSSDYVVLGISKFAKKLGISDYLIGFLVIGIGTSLPELVASITGALKGEAGLVFGTILGSNLSNLTLIFGTTIVISRILKVKKNEMSWWIFFKTLFFAIIPFILIYDSVLSRIDGLIMVGLYLVYSSDLWQSESYKMKSDVKIKFLWYDSLIFLGALVALLLSAQWLVLSAIQISTMVGISTFVMGLTIIAIGTSLPELLVSLNSVKQKHGDLAFGNLFGSIINNSVLVLGIVAIISPIKIVFKDISFASIFVIFSLVLVMLFMRMKEIKRWQGFLLLAIYILFVLIELIWQL